MGPIPPTSADAISVEGIGLHTGAPARVTLRARSGPVTLRAGATESIVSKLTIDCTARATTVAAHGGRLRVGTVEHLFAALAGLGLYEGLGIEVEGPEVPLLDGSAAAWTHKIVSLLTICDLAVASLCPSPNRGPPGPPAVRPRRSRIARAAVLEVGVSRYEFAPGDGVDVEVRLELPGFDASRVAPEARWTGDAHDFCQRIAPARTFAVVRDLAELLEGGLARHVDPTSVLVLTPEAVHCAGRPYAADEPARHKLLDLLGDLYVWGGPPEGKVRAVRPGHTANARAMERALAEGVVVEQRC